MAKSRNNEVMQGASGRIGRNLVFRQRGDKTVIARRPRINPELQEKPLTEKQIRARNRFLDASLYAKKTMENDDLKAAYKSKANVNQTAYNIALKDYMTDPELRRLDDRNYNGNVGDQITFLIRDILMVTDVQVEIVAPDDTLIESGVAIPLDNGHIEWAYDITEENPDFESSSYRITMLDTPKNTTVVQKQYGEDFRIG